MARFLLPLFLLALIAAPALAQSAAPDRDAIAEAERLGRMLFAYERAVAVASAVVLQLTQEDADPEEFIHAYAAVPVDGGWRVAFGRLADDKSEFLVAIDVALDDAFGVLGADVIEEPESRGTAFLDAALAILAAIDRFPFEEAPYNFAVLPAAGGDLYVYVMPAQTEPGYYPLGGDVRYRFDPRRQAITEEKRLHSSLQLLASEIDGELVSGTMSVSLLHEVPVETDVLLAMQRRPAIPHYVVAGDWVFAIDSSGAIEPIPAAEFGEGPSGNVD